MKKLNFSAPVWNIIFLLFSLFIGVGVCGQSRTLDKDVFQQLTAHYDHQIENRHLSGVETLVIQHDRVVWEHTQGFCDVSTGQLLQPNQIYYIQSMTKPIISVAIMQLVERGLLRLDDPVHLYIPEVKHLRVATNVKLGLDTPTEPLESDITIHQLVTHTAGLSHGLGKSKLDKQLFEALYNETLDYRGHPNLESRIDALLRFPLVAQPGSSWYYSASPDLLALILQRVSKISIPDYLEENIFKPLGMSDTGYNLNKEQTTRLVKLHFRNDQGVVERTKLQVPTTDNRVFGGTHGLFSTTKDFATFCLMILHHGTWKGKEILTSESVALMQTNQTRDLYKEKGAGFGVGFSVILDPDKMSRLGYKGQLQWGGYFSTHFFIEPTKSLIGIVFYSADAWRSRYFHPVSKLFIHCA